MKLPLHYIDKVIQTALEEDIPYIDLATDLLIDENLRGHALLVAKAPGILCGIDAALRVFSLLCENAAFEIHKKDGDKLQPGDKIASVDCCMTALLKGERTCLNVLQHMSGIATAARRCADLVSHTGAVVAETRKTLPGLRALQKYSVTVGGGRNHRFCLSDAAMVKDNHIDACGDLETAVKTLRAQMSLMHKIEVEARNIEELERALNAGADVVMLDNMNAEEMKKAVQINNGRAVLEASGNITEQNIKEIAETGVNVISLGALTHSVKALDISMYVI